MNNVNQNNGNETKSDIVQCDIFKSDTTSFFIKKYKNISMTFKIEIFWFYDKVNQTMEMKQIQTFLRETYSNMTLFFIGRKILKHFNYFYNCNFPFSL